MDLLQVFRGGMLRLVAPFASPRNTGFLRMVPSKKTFCAVYDYLGKAYLSRGLGLLEFQLKIRGNHTFSRDN